MKKTFVCLANSKKYGERCIAGVEISDFDGVQYSIAKLDSQPKWIRPVSNKEHGAVSSELVGKVQLLDVVEFEVSSECPRGYQSENVFFDESSLKIIGRLDWLSSNVEQFQSTDVALVFGNRGKAVHVDMIDQITHSLVLIRPDSLRFQEVTYPNGKHQVRCRFDYGGNEYDLPVTDIVFLASFNRDPTQTINFSDCFLTLSLGVEHNGFHSKLVAAVLGF